MRHPLILLIALVQVMALDNGLGLTPAMGYSTWNDYGCHNISAETIKEAAREMKHHGLDKLGYEYINIDDCWNVGRDEQGNLKPNPKTFPDGMKPVVDYVHSLGFKFGIYTDRGPLTCAGTVRKEKHQDKNYSIVGSFGHEEQDAKWFASIGADYLKEDSCDASKNHTIAFAEYGKMRDALNATGRPIYFSLCGWRPWYAPEGRKLGNSWRISNDVHQLASIHLAAQRNSKLFEYAGPGGWNDPDLLSGSSLTSIHSNKKVSRTQFSLWSVMAAPLILGSHRLNPWDLETYTNKEMISIDQDALGVQGRVVLNASRGNQQVWAKPLIGGRLAVIFLNWVKGDMAVTCDAACFAKLATLVTSNTSVQYHVRNVWTKQNLTAMVGGGSPWTVSIGGPGGSETYTLTKAL